MSEGAIIALLFGCLFLALALGCPIAFAIGGVGLIFIFLAWDPGAVVMIGLEAFAKLSSFSFLAIPLFILMANTLQESGLAEALYGAMHRWLGFIGGGLAMGTVIICVLFAAMAGISGAATVSMGLIALPAMLKRGYNSNIAIGCISAGGALGILIPPSVTMIIYGLIAPESVGRLFAGGVFPGLVLATLFITYIAVRARLQPSLAPAVPPEERVGWGEKFRSVKDVAAPILIILAVLGGIFGGITTISEAAAVGALASLICALFYRRLNWQVLRTITTKTLGLSCLVMWIVLGSTAFSAFFSAIGASRMIADVIAALEINRWLVLIAMQFLLLIMGMVMETTGIIMVTVPAFVPVIKLLGFDPVWFGVLFVMNMEMGFLTPPFGYNLFYMKGVVPKGITMGDIYRSVAPFVLLQALGLAICMIFPQIVLFLPNLIFGSF